MAAKKVVLADLLKDNRPVADPAPPAPQSPVPPAETAPDTQAPVAVPEPASQRPEPAAAATPSASIPRYLQLDRKETRIRAGQYEELTLLSRRLNRKRAGKGERITENTLIRVAIDLLFDRADDISGVDEEQIRKSVGLSSHAPRH